MQKILSNYFFPIFICLCFPFLSIAQDLILLGLQNESVNAITIDTTNPAIIYAGSSTNFSSGKLGGIFKTTNSGVTWDTLLRGIGVTDIVIHPKNPSIVFATLESNSLSSASILKTTDAGISWSWADSGISANPETWPQQLIFLPQNPEIMFCYTRGFTAGKLYKTYSAGSFWFIVNDSSKHDGELSNLIVDQFDQQRMFAINTTLESVIQSNDSGKSWTEINLGKPLARLLKTNITNQNKFALVIDTIEKPSVVYKTSGSGLYWSEIPGEIPDSVLPVDMIAFSGQIDECVYVITNKLLNSYLYFHKSNNPWQLVYTYNLKINKIYYHPAGYIMATGKYGLYKIDIATNVSDRIQNNNILENPLAIYAYPNPFNSNIEIIINHLHDKDAFVKIVDIMGKEILRKKITNISSANEFHFQWDGKRNDGFVVNSGIYFIQVIDKNFSSVKRIILLK